MCGCGLTTARETNAGGAKCARCGSVMPAGFDFCPVCGQDQRERWRRPETQVLRLHSGAPVATPAASTPPPPAVPAPAADVPYQRADHTMPTPQFITPAQMAAAAAGTPSLDHTVANPQMGMPPVTPQSGSRPSMPPIVSERVTEDDATVPAVAAGAPQSFEEAAFGATPSRPDAAALEDSKTIPFVSLQQRELLQQLNGGPNDGPSRTIPAMFVDSAPARPVVDATRPDRPGGFSGGPTGEAPPAGVNVAQRSHPPGVPVPSRLPTYPGVSPARLVLVARDGTEGESFPFAGEATVGRTHGDILFPEDPFLSPVHARLSRSGDGMLLSDNGSTNGVYMRIGNVAPVYPGDMFMIGHQLLRLDQLDSQAQEHPPGVDGTRLFGTPLQPAWGRVTQLGRGGVAGDHMYLRGSRVSFGREGGDLVFPNDPFVSREHARLRLEITGQAMAVFLEDLGSANGSYVRIRGAAQIASGDTFRVGDQILKLRLD